MCTQSWGEKERAGRWERTGKNKKEARVTTKTRRGVYRGKKFILTFTVKKTPIKESALGKKGLYTWEKRKKQR